MGIVTVWGPPGSGKTTLAIDLAFALSAQNRSVCLISAESYSELSARLQIHVQRKNSLLAAYRQPGTLNQIVCKVEELLFMLSVPSGSDVFSQEENSRAVRELLKQARSFFDFVIVDCPSGAGSTLSAWAMRMADDVLLLTGGRPRDGEWHKSYRRAVWEVSSKLIYVCTEIVADFDYTALFDLIGAVPEIRLPYIRDAEYLQVTHRTLFHAGSGKQLRSYSDRIKVLCERLEGKRT